MKLITETIEDVEILTEAKEGTAGKDYYIKGIFMQGGIKNRNGRVYPVDVLANECNRYVKESVNKNKAYGELGHPDGPVINLHRVSHKIVELKQEGNNFIGKAKIMDTPMGKIVKNLIDEECQLGVSSRGMGTLKNNRGVAEVQKDFQLATAGDIVADPSAPNAFVEGVMEGVEWYYDTERKIWLSEKVKNKVKKASKRNLAEVKMQAFEDFINNL
jgi:hypothetical protein